ncbi:N-acetylmuramoyl-L-alanine amidase [[Actinobacillus] muris]|uniref:N-acetylmuramoyl-L-alanine amidase n=1 Tax=Muribacter muris TaxID=67855 RepID=A0A0J5P7Q6_9PAST|nr:N-acetylmuramoyl-L-alanine amidase [Muribacter muris]KMK51534.1 N-acetylmuramoyl-L-alanine amidase [[Actinobacillus] muris] [Muribacter muris]
MKNKCLTYLQTAVIGLCLSVSVAARTVVAIDAGHGGKDPGAIGKTLGVKEKDVTLAIARELKGMLDADPNFKAVMTRNRDYFIPLPNRTEIARKNRANFLISIHADSSPSSENLKGASVWVLSNRRANDELGKWLEDHEKQSELLGGAGSVLAHTNERYLNQTVLDLQFSHAQRSGYELGKAVLGKLSNITPLVKSSPQHASLSVLRSPDIPSILVETGFLSNAVEEQKLATAAYRRQIARAIYNGLVAYRNAHPALSRKVAYKAAKNGPQADSVKNVLADMAKNAPKTDKKESSVAKGKEKSEPKESKQKQTPMTQGKSAKATADNPKADNAKSVDPNAAFHIVKQDETLYSIARMYKTSPEKLSKLNNIKDNKIVVGKKLKLK